MFAVSPWVEPKATACLVLADGLVLMGEGAGAQGTAVGELCFNTSVTGYQEILTDPSYAGQIVTFTFPHIGNVGANEDDVETVAVEASLAARGCVLRAPITAPQNWRSRETFGAWLAARGIVAITGVDTRAITARIRDGGMVNCALAHNPNGDFDIEALREMARTAPDMAGAELATTVSGREARGWTRGAWGWDAGTYGDASGTGPRIVALDYGIKGNILNLLSERGANVTVMPASSTLEEVMAARPEGIFLSNGPGDPGATGEVVGETLRGLLGKGIPTFGICLGHQLIGNAIGASTKKMKQGHHGANHPVLDIEKGRVSIVSMNHGFTVDAGTLPENAKETHRSLFDGTNCGLALTDRPAFSVQYHPEASPGPQDSYDLFDRFLDMVREHAAANA
ncbi:glutamine-hydrolyzing carbamoyl-phosphate synthase small subunit [Acuticoccus sp. MNP-M23]|uniref:glutamine-hydrolyzing carbamoyl-phosphate synthase small subunit n=1 Tax=Acuticoccus sp. MNP-M23 TaxID=3072793 RepID=UPI0028153DD1|nr:glutamine-hydrolyzing carbamoyl-phosphate synthase small subunit [Acuticoccus sp. MNP-M23]WMS40783.1 glutamine-hydrolyzing carbamoyl-phosphate synthase small subunit [Acuticoccus sp. MNP-M23]